MPDTHKYLTDLKTQFRNIKFAFIFSLIILFAGCKIATQLSIKQVNDNSVVRYALYYNNRTANHKPIGIYVSVDTLKTRSRSHKRYGFYLNSDTVEKFQNYLGQRVNYILVTDSTIKSSNEILFQLTPLESEIFDKVIYYSDSLKLKDFDFLKKAKGFKIISQKRGYYLKTK